VVELSYRYEENTMTVRYIPVENTHEGTDLDALAHNNNMLAEGVRGIKCDYVGQPSMGQTVVYDAFMPDGTCFLAVVEEYANGARNFKVKNVTLDAIVGYIIVRP
jgi:hypothetical protein